MNSPIANRTRSKIRENQQDNSNRVEMTDREQINTPDMTSSESEHQNENAGRQENSPHDFVGFDLNDPINININNLYRSYMGSIQSLDNQSIEDASNNPGNIPHTYADQNFNASNNPGNIPHTHADQNFNASNNPGFVPHSHTDQNFNANHNTGHSDYTHTGQTYTGPNHGPDFMPRSHVDQSYAQTNRNFGPHMHNNQNFPNYNNMGSYTHPNYYNFNAPVGNSGLGRVDKSTLEWNQYQTLKKVLDRLSKTVESKYLEVKYILEDETLTGETETIELLEDFGEWFDSQKGIVSKKSSIVAHTLTTLHPTSQVFDNFYDLMQDYNTVEKQILSAVNKIKKRTAQYQKNKEISHKERISLPKFKGDFLDFDRYRTSFTSFCKGLGEEDRKQHLINSLETEPFGVIEPLVNADQPFQVVWEALVEHFANPKEITDSACARFLNKPIPPNQMNDLAKHYIEMKNFAANIMRLNITFEEFLVQVYLLKIPGEFRANLEHNLPKDKSRYLFKDLTPCVNTTIRSKKYNPGQNIQVNTYPAGSDVTATPGVVNQPNTNKHKGSRYGKGHKKIEHCIICGKGDHTMGNCETYKKGPEMRKKLQEMGRCDQCLQLATKHKAECRVLSGSCKTCGDNTHFHITCDGNKHPGSWLRKMCSKDPTTKTVTQTVNSQ